MNSFLKRLRVRWAMGTKTLGYSDEFLKGVYSIYLNHNKVIHFKDGYPVYSLSTPPLFSKPSANFFARILYRVLQNKPMPNLLSFAVNDVCNANCQHCSFFTSVDDKTKKVLTLDEIRKLMKDAQDLGVSVVNLVGGEPLMRPDLCEVIKTIDKDLSTAILFTNGWLLADRAKEIAKAGLDGVYISIDSANPEIHNKKRGTEGLFAKAIEGILIAKKVGLTVGISCCMDENDFRGGELDRIIALAKSKGVHEVLVFDALPVGRYGSREDLIGHKKWVNEMIEHVKKYNIDESYPGVIIYAYSTSHMAVGCSCGSNYLYITPYGEICPCDFYHRRFGSIREEPLYKIWERMSSSEGFGRSKWGGCRVKEGGASDNLSKGDDECYNCDIK
jgi:radical SAM protein with 4Fe4S-binding SPASM domain